MTPLAYDRVGRGAPTLCLHPIGLDRTCWNAAVSHLADVELIRVDLAGHGLSPDRDAAMRIEDDADRVAALMDDLGLERVAVVGVSFGGMVGQTLALRHPDRVDALVAAACPPGIPAEARDALEERGRRALKGGMAAVVDATMERWFGAGFREAPEAQATRGRLLADDPRNWAAAWQAIAQFDLRPELPRIACPVLALAGKEDLATPIEAMRDLASGVPDGTLEVIEGAPHMLHIEAAGAFGAHVGAFLNRVLQDRRAPGR